jgi:hypothetical protein
MNEPRTRSLSEVVDAIEIVQSELGFQLMRLDSHVRPKTESEDEYLPKLKEGYEQAQYWIGVLYRYQKGRLDRLDERVQPLAEGSGPFMDEGV